MKRFVKNILLALIGFCLLVFAIKDLPLQKLGATLMQANYELIIPVFAVTLFGYFIRIKRWLLLFKQIDANVTQRSAWVALCAGYLVSYAIPRGGEITRCLLIKRYNSVPINISLASVIIDRLADTVMLVLLIVGIVLFNVQGIATFFTTNIFQPIWAMLPNPIILILLSIGIIGTLLAYVFFNRKNIQTNNFSWADEFIVNFRQLARINKPITFIFYTLLIWFCYFLMTYFWIFAFDESAALPILQVFVIMIIGTIGKSVPIQGGGMGAYHFLVAQVFILYGISEITGNALAIIIHGAQSIFTLLSGIIAYSILMYDEKKRNL